ncbi:heme A synthase [Schumannella sp. 10F1B-5-1]|uniref:COX15/CtaA family protein n=1 Tax=Schumannella sp. 10F1B-5-1 TaxID=2590780 RepID=UPI00113259D1|nr:COX15/CtaA family protein [Schumannella sp. 10F1B-5-1]TPW70970.1 heme A synthase [Schumannella sp. 10F1B-5-1]
MRITTPLGWAAARWRLGPRALRWGTTAALVVSVLIVLGGGVVRVTGSGLGCPTWPTCDGESVILVVPDSIHLLIEQTNRMLTGLLIVAVGWAIVAARLQRPRDRVLTRLAWSQFWLVVANAVAGGFTVLFKLSPWMVAVHFVLAIGLLATATLTWHRARAGLRQEHPPRAPRLARGLAWALVSLTLLLILVGTLVTGSGPHSGDSTDVPRMPFDWASVTVVHAVLGSGVLVLAIALLLALRGYPLARRRVIAFIVVTVLQGALGATQALTGLPEWQVALHLVGAALVWIGALRVLLDTDTRLFAVHDVSAPRAAAEEPAVTAS